MKQLIDERKIKGFISRYKKEVIKRNSEKKLNFRLLTLLKEFKENNNE